MRGHHSYLGTRPGSPHFSHSTCRAVLEPSSGLKMPALHIEDLPEKEKLKMEVEQLRKEVKLQRQQVNCPRMLFPSLK